MGTMVYIDGFNLYYGALRGTPHKWLDLEQLTSRLLPQDHIAGIRYFTARINARPDDPQQAQRQETYLRALRTLPSVTTHFGRFLSHPTRMPLADPEPGKPRTIAVIKTEEKGSDVNLASHLLLDAFRGTAATAVVVSNDSDLRVPIRIVETEFEIPVGIVNPHPAGRRSRALKSTFFKQIRPRALADSQLPDVLVDEAGVFHKPPTW